MSSQQRTAFWILLPVGVIAITVAVWFLGKAVAGYMSKSREAGASSTAKVIRDKSGESDAASRLSLGQNTRPPEEQKAAEPPQQTPEEAARAEQSKVVVEEEPATGTATTPLSGMAETVTNETQPPAAAQPETQTSGGAAAGDVIYHVQLGKFDSKDNADGFKQKLKNEGIDAAVILETTSDGNTKWRVQSGAYRNKTNAEEYARELELKGYKVYVNP